MLRMSKRIGVVAAALLLAGFVAPTLAAENAGSHPGSLLLYPYFSNEAGIDTYIRVTNSGPAFIPAFVPDIQVHFVFFFTAPRTLPNRPICQKVSSFQPMTPNDTLLTTSDFEAPGAPRGFFIVKASTDVFGGPDDIKWDFLTGDEIVVNTAEGWAWAINAIGILADQDAVQGAIIAAPDEGPALLGAVEDEFGGADVDALDYEYISFPENFYFHYLTTRFSRETQAVIIALPRNANGTATYLDDTTLITTLSPPFADAQFYQYDVTFYDADEREFSAPRDQVDCFDVRSASTLAGTDLTLFATRGFGWMNVFGFDNFGVATFGTNRALLMTIDRPSVGGVLDAFAGWPAQDVTPDGAANQVGPYLPTTTDVSRF